MKEHKCKRLNEEFVITTGPSGWFLSMRHMNVSCQITHCPFCGKVLDDRDDPYIWREFGYDGIREADK